MSGDRAALDTNAAIALLNGEPGVEQLLDPFDTLCLSSTVIGELLLGALNSSKPGANLARLQNLIDSCEPLDVTPPTARVYAELRLDLKKAGRPIPENDIWIAAAAVEHALPLITRDVHFSNIQRLQVFKLP
jgi:tRNA(fMet)-specific endonuclease VapC